MTPDQSLTMPVAPADRPASRRLDRRLGITVAGIAVSIACLYLALRGTNLREIASTLASANLWLAVPLLATQVAFYILKAVRWRLLLAPVHETTARRLAAPMMIGFMGNNLLPARLGELIRLHLGARVTRLSHTQVLATLVLERLFDFIAIVALFAAGAIAVDNVPPTLVSAGYASAAVTTVAMIATVVYVSWTPATLRLVRIVTRPLPGKVAGAVYRQLELGASGMAALRQPQLLAGIIGTSLLQWFLMGACIYWSFLAVGIDAPFAAVFVVLAATVFGVMVPAAPGFFGTLHLTFVLALTPFAVDEGPAMAAAVFYHIIPYAAVILAGAFYLRQMGTGLRGIERAALDESPAA